MILITGAGGTIGSELSRQLYEAKHELLLLDNCEYNLWRIGQTLPCQAVLGDIRSEKLIERLFSTNPISHVFHAAAIKHVPIAEANVSETVQVNVFGTKIIADACKRHGAKLVMISTDKAVNPISVMGKSKAIAEAYCIAIGGCAVARFGNVIASSGSVIPLFESQIAAGGPVTITHPDVERYFMTVEEAVSLVISIMDKEGIFSLDMGQPKRILDIALDMIWQSGKNIPIEFIGLRPGEKLREDLNCDPIDYDVAHIEAMKSCYFYDLSRLDGI